MQGGKKPTRDSEISAGWKCCTARLHSAFLRTLQSSLSRNEDRSPDTGMPHRKPLASIAHFLCLGTNAAIFLPFLISCTRQHLNKVTKRWLKAKWAG